MKDRSTNVILETGKIRKYISGGEEEGQDQKDCNRKIPGREGDTVISFPRNQDIKTGGSCIKKKDQRDQDPLTKILLERTEEVVDRFFRMIGESLMDGKVKSRTGGTDRYDRKTADEPAKT